MISAPLFRWLTLVSYFGLMLTLLGWIILAPHAESYPISAWILIGIVPLLFPLRGLLYGRPYTHAWTSFLMLFYFSHSVGEVYSAEQLSLYPVMALLFSTVCFCSTILFIKFQAKMRNESQN
ncbi:DUF2069 domain-containing protein [Methylophaga sp.]|uniref:DUF2069 domain-containing protein n=1 Tax=Methylophaga sp. TaxID=2024840 RepID=UPI003F6A4A56